MTFPNLVFRSGFYTVSTCSKPTGLTFRSSRPSALLVKGVSRELIRLRNVLLKKKALPSRQATFLHLILTRVPDFQMRQCPFRGFVVAEIDSCH